MKILILDDLKSRHDVFDNLFKDHDVFHAFTVSDFVSKLKDDVFDLICLDHNLGETETWIDGWNNKREFNGVDAAVKICELEDHALPKKVMIHSMNPVGARSMLNLLYARGISVDWQPFGKINEDHY